MNLAEKIFIYCERGRDPAFWGEPLNAVSNAAFLIAALVAALHYARTPPAERTPPALLLIALTFVIGIGSFLFHTYATRWASLADQIPIAIFMLAYLGFVLRRFLGLNWFLVVLGVAAFYAVLRYAGSIDCRYDGLLPITAATGARCFNGSLGYAPAGVVLGISAFVLAVVGHPAWRALALATLVFAASLSLRTLDIEICELTRIGGRAWGSHFLWHVLNATTLYLLLRAAVRYGAVKPPQARGAPAPV
jgi:hypothetical protein